MAKPILFLNIEQGPKAGCRLECNAAAIASIGRARANTLQISRDSGISQKHLCIQWDDDEGVGWVAMDAGSSNGTIINDVHIEPHKGFAIHNRDLIKIGAETTIRVEILGVPDEDMTGPKAREGPRRKGTCAISESRGKGMSVVAKRHQRKAGDAFGKPLAAQECHGKLQDVMEGVVCHGKLHINNAVEDHGKHQDVMISEVHHGKHNVNNNAVEEGDGKQQDTMTAHSDCDKHPTKTAAKGHDKQQDTTTAYKDHDDHHIYICAEECNSKQQDSKTAYKDHCKHRINSAAKGGHGKQQDTAVAYEDHDSRQIPVVSTSRDNEHGTKIVAAAGPDIDLSMTVEQWFQHMMEEGPKYLYQVSEAIIQEVMLESKQFDEYVLSLG
eukprot:c16451_g1_i1 orf=350-1498(-)